MDPFEDYKRERGLELTGPAWAIFRDHELDLPASVLRVLLGIPEKPPVEEKS